MVAILNSSGSLEVVRQAYWLYLGERVHIKGFISTAYLNWELVGCVKLPWVGPMQASGSASGRLWHSQGG